MSAATLLIINAQLITQVATENHLTVLIGSVSFIVFVSSIIYIAAASYKHKRLQRNTGKLSTTKQAKKTKTITVTNN